MNLTKLFSTVNLKEWVEENRAQLKPPVANKVVYEDGEFIVMVVGGPNSRKDYHFNETPEFFYQVEGDILLKIIVDGEFVDVPIKEGEIYLLPSNIPHSPVRYENTIGLVIEQKRPEGMLDACEWYCENCGNQLFRAPFPMDDIVKSLPTIFNEFYPNEALRTCDNCGTVMEPPK
ncbi:3-hydroxyanthranilate 3,4-dioxygenase [Sediminitomix flava]|uniref:3-hydroxyanthranilate 3,4-dioxygenase n=1 Tax=Sediminitomix flava TaxID=379075 RepID=A0A315ZA05_SEDFL|nr:3-hydroxyanthranilate 3,4-dioxygenase [Sediminitomix flava]PWJ42112.1 3-hydroxyanthranilate 3,4-dioxygenase [Sediminitomix flava]